MGRKTTRRRAPARRRRIARKNPVRRRAVRRPARRMTRRATAVRRRKTRKNPSFLSNPTVQTVGFAGLGYLAGQYVSAEVAKAKAAGDEAGGIGGFAAMLEFSDKDGKVIVPAQLTIGAIMAVLGLGMGYKVGNAKIRNRMLAAGLGMFISPASSYLSEMTKESKTETVQAAMKVRRLKAPIGSGSFVNHSRAVASDYAS